MRSFLDRFGLDEGRVGRILVTFLLIGFAALLAAGVSIWWVADRNQEHARWVSHTYEVELATTQGARLVEQAETARRGFLLTRDPAFLRTYRAATDGWGESADALRALIQDNPAQLRRLSRAEAMIGALADARQRSMTLAATGDIAGAMAMFQRDVGGQRMRAIRTMFGAMAAQERGLLQKRDQDAQQSAATFYSVLLLAGVIVILVALGALFTVLRYTRSLAASRAQLQTLAGSLEDQVSVRTADLARANEEIQRFAYIVSHDLRAPLVNVMGFTAELDGATGAIRALLDRAEAEAPHIVDEESRLAAREDLPEAIGFIRTSTQKMDRLINAILGLSRQGRRVLTPETIDVAAMVETIGASLVQQLETRDGEIMMEGAMPHIVTDRLAIEQIFSNLIENAIKYAQPGRPLRIAVRGERLGPHVTYEIDDNGRGIDPKDHARVFDLFRRSGTQDQPGEGIGLANVRALAYRLGGVIDLSSKLGEGALFRVTLPVHLEPAQVQS
ncbi:Histidine kinase [Sphingomonas sp. EC-HK361]|uniref:sensor histidine kinase n=1 Tax=Sphingomonas sp. EC-HK361 TaxID=2038397 RepID=UPI00125B4441|nr:sensor histidine kinase [Sphingomonas sp. EC-HK361]VVS97108.1 Histidine kinase [Sphingomonas sp. EC-HK361]